MEIDAPNTKTVLVLAAGELFAEHGFEGVSTRMIADKAGVNLGGIHYHFGTKEALYVAAFRYVCEKDDRPSLSHLLAQRPEIAESKEGLSEAILIACRNFIHDIFDPDKPLWRTRLIVRELSSPSSAMPILVEEIFKGDLLADTQLYQRIKPEASEDEAIVWSNMMKSQAIFYLMAKAPIELVREGKPLDNDFVEQLIRMTARAMILLTGLPMPAELKEKVGNAPAH
jgi:AcrR family transcriptional regulator